jgi:hypothetical protein
MIWSVVAIAFMASMADLLGEKEVIFPEVAALFIMFEFKMMFPPLPALAVIPFILPQSYLLFPVEVAVGGAYSVVAGLFSVASIKAYLTR